MIAHPAQKTQFLIRKVNEIIKSMNGNVLKDSSMWVFVLKTPQSVISTVVILKSDGGMFGLGNSIQTSKV